MALAALVVGVLALAVATASLGVSFWHSRASVRDLEAQRRADLTARRVSGANIQGGGHLLRVEIRNVGRGPAWHVLLSLVDGDDQTIIQSYEELALWPGDPWLEFAFAVTRPSEELPKELYVHALWKDYGSGQVPRTKRILTVRGPRGSLLQRE